MSDYICDNCGEVGIDLLPFGEEVLCEDCAMERLEDPNSDMDEEIGG